VIKKVSPGLCELETLTSPQLSVAVGIVQVAISPQTSFALVISKSVGGQLLTTGFKVSRTSTWKIQKA